MVKKDPCPASEKRQGKERIQEASAVCPMQNGWPGERKIASLFVENRRRKCPREGEEDRFSICKNLKKKMTNLCIRRIPVGCARRERLSSPTGRREEGKKKKKVGGRGKNSTRAARVYEAEIKRRAPLLTSRLSGKKKKFVRGIEKGLPSG